METVLAADNLAIVAPTTSSSTKSIDAQIISSANSDIGPTKGLITEAPTTENIFSTFRAEVIAKPFLSLLTEYLLAANGKQKTRENIIQDFRVQHTILFSIIFLLDFVLRILYLAILLFLVFRGLGLVKY